MQKSETPAPPVEIHAPLAADAPSPPRRRRDRGAALRASTAAIQSAVPRWLRLPPSVSWRKVRWPVAISIVVVHALALLAALPWLFSWSGLAMVFAGVYVFGTLGINICFHRLLTHRSFKTPVWLERVFALLGVCCLQGSPASWVAHHRMHHQHSDEEPDPHSPLVAFLWSHIGWMLVENRDINSRRVYERYARDLCKDRFYFGLEHKALMLGVYFAHIAAFFLAGLLIGGLVNQNIMSGVQLGLSWVIWGVIVRTVVVWHITWSVNSITHLWGYRNYETGENSQNNWLVAILSNGEGWHNNHHADQRSAAHGHRWWEIDISYLTILVMKWVGLASNVVSPERHKKKHA